MPNFWGDTKKIEELYKDHYNKVENCVSKFIEVIKLYVENGDTERVRNLSKNVHKLESNADDIRRKIIKLLVKEKYLLPNTRRDFLTLLEYIDKIADYTEAALDYVILQSMDVSEIGRDKLFEMLDLTLKQYMLLEDAIDYLFEDMEDAYDLVAEVEQIESEIDDIERLLISRVSDRDDLNYGLKALYRDFITMIGNISDIVEDTGDEIELIIAMRKV